MLSNQRSRKNYHIKLGSKKTRVLCIVFSKHQHDIRIILYLKHKYHGGVSDVKRHYGFLKKVVKPNKVLNLIQKSQSIIVLQILHLIKKS